MWFYGKADFDAITAALDDTLPASESFASLDVNAAWEKFKVIFLNTMSTFIPNRMIHCKRSLPWITKAIRKVMRLRDRARASAKQSGASGLWSWFRVLRNRAVAAVRSAKRTFFMGLSKKISSLKEFWKVYRSICRNVQPVPSVMTNGVSTACSPLDKAELLNGHFASCFTPRSPIDLATLPSHDGEVLSSVSCSSMDVFSEIVSLRRNIASGPDGISSVMLRGSASSISDHLAAIFNKSLSAGVVPDDWKHSRVTPVFKSGESAEVANYRPISLLPLVSKLLERQVHNALMQHVLEHGHLSDLQYGFRPGSSTQEAVLAVTRDWHKVLEGNGSVVCVFFDLSKAFDSLPHSLILKSLVRVGVRGTLLQWFSNYLSDRRQFVALQGSSSSSAEVTSGVPQGSILGPLLFILAVDPLTSLSISNSSILRLYADDIAYYKPLFSTSDLLALQGDVDIISLWVDSHDLSINAKKTKLMVVSRKRSPPSPVIVLKGAPIERVSSFRYLGVVLSSDLSWSLHIQATCSKARRLLGFLYRNFTLADKRCLSYLYCILVRPVLEYSCCVWDPFQVKYSVMLERVQNFAGRLATKRWRGEPDSLRGELGWPLLSTRRSYLKLCLCRRILAGYSMLPCSVFEHHPSQVVRHVNSCPLFKPFVKTQYHRGSFFLSTIPVWNSIPDSIISLNSNLAFRRTLKKYLVL